MKKEYEEKRCVFLFIFDSKLLGFELLLAQW